MNLKPITVATRGFEPRFYSRGWYAANFMEHLEWNAEAFVKEGFDTIIDHLKVARVKYDACRITVFKLDLLWVGKGQLLHPQVLIAHVCVKRADLILPNRNPTFQNDHPVGNLTQLTKRFVHNQN